MAALAAADGDGLEGKGEELKWNTPQSWVNDNRYK